jgi:hypothetical protein
MTRDQLTSMLTWTGALAVCLSGACASPIDGPIDEGPVNPTTEALWIDPTATKWPGVANVCFQGFTTNERANIKATLQNGWPRIAYLNMTGWGTCPALSSTTTNLLVLSIDPSIAPNDGISNVCTNQNVASCTVDVVGKAAAGDYNRIRFFDSTPDSWTILHEFGHALGFIHETTSSSGCAQRTSGGTSLENEPDGDRSIMGAFRTCQDENEGELSAWDIMGARRTYGPKRPGNIVGRGNLGPNISGGTTAENTNIVSFPVQGNAWNQEWKRDNNSLLLKATTGSTSRCLNVKGGVVGTGFTDLVSWSCSESFANEQFHFKGVQWLAMGNHCMQAESATQSSIITLEECSTSSLQQWDFFEKDRRIRLSGTALCVNVPNGNTANGTQLILWPCSTGTPFANEVFTFSNGLIKFSTKSFNVANGTVADGNPLILWTPGSPTHHNEIFTIRGPIKALNQCLDMANGSLVDGTKIGVRPCSGSATQTWEYWW